MTLVAEIVFWGSVALVLYAYLGYPCALWALSLFRSRPVRGSASLHAPFASHA